MNNFNAIHVEYIRANRTIETICVSNLKVKKTFYLYNFEGISFRLFDSLSTLIHFFESGNQNYKQFNTEFQLDKYLAQVNLFQ
jgi:hypothetical protein